MRSIGSPEQLARPIWTKETITQSNPAEQEAFSIRDILTSFVESFNVNDLDRVMALFAEDSISSLACDQEHHGGSAIREAFEPQFRGGFGKMYFIELDKDEDGNTVFRLLLPVQNHNTGTMA